jgi:DNA-directed RNA polymerase subunit beta
VARAYEPLTQGVVRQLIQLGHKTAKVVTASPDDLLITSLRKDTARDEDEALKEIYRRLRPGDPPTTPNARALVKRLFFDPKRYDLTRVGRYKINQKLTSRWTPTCASSPPRTSSLRCATSSAARR